jgi:hypothetical protein
MLSFMHMPPRRSPVAPRSPPAAGRLRQGAGAPGTPVRALRGREPSLREKRPSWATRAGQGAPGPRTTPAAPGAYGEKRRGAPRAPAVPGLPLHRAPAASTPGECDSPAGAPPGGPSTPQSDTRRPTVASRARPATGPRGVGGGLSRCRGPIAVQGTGLLDPPPAPLLWMAAMGTAPISGAADTGGQSRRGLADGQIGPRAMACEPESGAGDCPARTIL